MFVPSIIAREFSELLIIGLENMTPQTKVDTESLICVKQKIANTCPTQPIAPHVRNLFSQAVNIDVEHAQTLMFR
jgi:hypothetical protein